MLALAALPVTAELLWHMLQQPAWWGGVIAAVLLYRCWAGLRAHLRFVRILDHELSHVLMCVLWLQQPTRLEINVQEGGAMHYRGQGQRGELWITLAPYVWRLPVLLLSMLSPLFDQPEYQQLFWLLYGVVCTYSVWAIITEWHPQQTDLQYMGMRWSLAYVLPLHVIGWGVALSIVFAEADVLDLLNSMYEHFKWAGRWLWQRVS